MTWSNRNNFTGILVMVVAVALVNVVSMPSTAHATGSSTKVAQVRQIERPMISSNGRYVVFTPYGGYHDRNTGLTTQLGIEYPKSLSADGRYIIFSKPTGISTDTGVFVRDCVTGVTSRVDVSSAGVPANDTSYARAITSDGRFVVFNSVAFNLVDGGVRGVDYTYVHDRLLGTTVRVSVTANSINVGISADGRYLAFSSWETNLVDGDTNGQDDVFVHDRSLGVTTRVSVETSGTQFPFPTRNPSISADGRYVAFESDWPEECIFVHDRDTGSTVLADQSSGVELNMNGNPSISADGRYVVFAAHGIRVRDLEKGTTTLVSLDNSGVPLAGVDVESSISGDGRYVAFTAAGTAGGESLYVYDSLREAEVFDTQAPTLLSSSITTAVVDVSLSYRDITFEVFVSDDLSGVDSQLSGVQLSGLWGEATEVTPLTLVSGDQLGGTYTQTLRIPKHSWGGAWVVNMHFTDRDGHGVVIRSDELLQRGLPDAVWVVTETQPPVTTSDAKADYEGSASIFLYATDANVAGVVKTEWRLDNGDWTPGAGVTTSQVGTHVLEFRSTDFAGNVESTQSVSFTVWTPTVIILGSPAMALPSVPAYGSVQLNAQLYYVVAEEYPSRSISPLAGKTLVFERWTGMTWSAVCTATTDSEGKATKVFTGLISKQVYRVRSADTAPYRASESDHLIFMPKVRLTPRTSLSTLKRRRTYYTTGVIQPAHAISDPNKVRFRAYKKGVDGAYHYVKSFDADFVYTSGSGATYRAAIKRLSPGKWKLVAYHAADAQNAETYGKPDYVIAE